MLPHLLQLIAYQLSSFTIKHQFNNNKKDGYRQRNVRQFLHILASPGYIPIYLQRLRAIVRYWLEIATISYPCI